MQKEVTINSKYKDTVFRMIFSKKEHMLELYNAINNTSYINTDDLEITTLENAVYMNFKNDVSFIFDFQLNIYEHQSTYNPNMPLRDLIYVSRELEVLISTESLYASKLIQIPTPRFIVFYNGDDKRPEKTILKLSDAYQNQLDELDLELKVTVLNVNYGKNKELMKACETLKEYSEFVSIIRNNKQKMDNIGDAVKSAIDECIERNILRNFLIKQRLEVIAVSIYEYDEEEELKKFRLAEYEVGVAAGIKEGREEGREERQLMISKIKQSLILILQDKPDVPPSLFQTIDDEMNPERLTQFIVLTAKANTGKELEEQIKNMK